MSLILFESSSGRSRSTLSKLPLPLLFTAFGSAFVLVKVPYHFTTNLSSHFDASLDISSRRSAFRKNVASPL